MIRSAVNLIFNKIKYESEVIFSLQEELPFISCRPQELGQVLINLLANAGQAIEEKKEKGLFPEGIKERPGKIEISTNIKKSIFPNGSDAIEISLKDNGIGIPEDALSRIFDPFFTTKEIGVGTGLGLSISMDIIRKHQGHIDVESVKCQGTTFHIYLPMTERKDDK
nr:ATP-binding protein [Leptospira ilyithenensis]